MINVLWVPCVVRGIILASRRLAREMVRFVEQHNITLVLDDVVFGIEEVKQAYQRLEKQQHFSKVNINFRT